MLYHLRAAAAALGEFDRDAERPALDPDSAREAGELLVTLLAGLDPLVAELARDVDGLSKRYELIGTKGGVPSAEWASRAAGSLDEMGVQLSEAHRSAVQYRGSIANVEGVPRPAAG